MSATLEDKKYIYQPNAIKGNKPINIGHSNSVIVALPERISLYFSLTKLEAKPGLDPP